MKLTKIKCFKCGDVIQSDGNGKFVQCSCGGCYIDETKYYCRVGGNFDTYFVEKDGDWILAKDYIKEQQDGTRESDKT